MSSVSNLESTIGGWYKSANVPHLPKNAQQWLADNVWWLALIGAILSVLGLVAIVPLFLLSVGLSTATIGLVPLYAHGGLYWLGALVNLVGYIITTILLVVSVTPLKVKVKRGWELLFWSYVINFGFGVVSALVNFSIIDIFGALIGAAIAGYFLYEIRGYFGVKHKTATKKTA